MLEEVKILDTFILKTREAFFLKNLTHRIEG